MSPLILHEFHHSLGAQFMELNGAEVVNGYGDWLAEHAALRESTGVIDLSFRSRICLAGEDRVRFLHGQVTNDVKKLRTGEGCYAAITTAKGKMESDLPHYGLLSVQGPKAESTIHSLGLFSKIPAKPFDSVKISDATLGEIYLANNPRLFSSPLPAQRGEGHSINQTSSPRPSPPFMGGEGEVASVGFDLFVPNNSLGAVADKLIAAAKQIGGQAIGWQAFETARIEAAIPRNGTDMDETNIPLECGIESRAIVYNKGCYIGQEVINRIHSIGHVNRELRGLRLASDLKTLPQKHDKLFHAGKEVGYVTSAVKSRTCGNIALGYVRREANQIGNELMLRMAASESVVKIVELPFCNSSELNDEVKAKLERSRREIAEGNFITRQPK
jgi:folate-binding protein YgfZ